MNPERKKYILSLAVIVILGFAAYANSLTGEFIWDDLAFVRDNELIRDWSNVGRVFSKDMAKSLAPGGGGVKYNFYRPLQMISLMADYSIWRLDTAGYHFTNTIFHILAALAIFWLITVLSNDWLLALFTGALFVIHPIHTEAVAFISGRADPMAAVFMLLAFIFYIKAGNSAIFSFLTLLSYTLALLSRETSVIFPVLLLLYHYSFKKKIRPGPYLSVLGITAFYILLRSTMARHLLSGENVASFAGAFQRMPGFFVAITGYVRILLLPFNLHMEYGKALFKASDPGAILGAGISALLLIHAFKKRNSNKLVFFSILWFFITLLPQSNIYPIGAYMAEHWLYLPSVGLFLIISDGLVRLVRMKNVKILGIGAALILLLTYSYLTIRQNEYWSKLIPFYERTLTFNPKSPRLLNNLGVAYHDIKKHDKAIAAYEKSIKLGPDYFETHSNLGSVYHGIGEYDKAEALYKKEIAMNPTYPKAYNNLGALYDDTGEYERAVEAYKKAIELNPDKMEMYFNLGLAYQNANKYQKSIAAYKKAIELKPGFTNAYHDLGVTYHKAGEHEKAIQAYQEAIKRDPKQAEMYGNLGMANEMLGRTEKAIAAYKKAIALDENHALSHNNLAILYFRQKQYNLAIEHADEAIKLGHKPNPEFLRDLKPHRPKQ